MSDVPSRPRAAPAAGAAEPDDPLAADKRTLTVGVIAMLLFVAIGVGSAQLFVTGGCAGFGDPQASTASVVDPGEVVADDGLGELEGAFGASFTDAVVVPGDATGVTLLPDGPVVTGDTVTALRAPLDPRIEVDVPGTVVGDGTTLFDLTLANELTGQVDGFTPLAGFTLEPGECTDTARVDQQFAFLLDAADGRLLQLRIDEDGDEPVVELRDRQGTLSALELTLPAGPAGVQGERVTGAIGQDRVVTARRAGPDDPGAAVVVSDVETGDRLLELDRDDLADAVAPLALLDDAQAPLRIAVHVVDEDVAVLSVRPDPADDAAGESALVTLDLDTGELAPLGAGPGEVVAAVAGPDGAVAAAYATSGEDAGVSLAVVGADQAPVSDTLPGSLRSLRWDGDAPVLVTDGGYAAIDRSSAGAPARQDDPSVDVRDVAVLDGRLLVLVRAEGRSVLLAE